MSADDDSSKSDPPVSADGAGPDPPNSPELPRARLEGIAARAGARLELRGSKRPASAIVFAAGTMAFVLLFGMTFSRQYDRSQKEHACFQESDERACAALCKSADEGACAELERSAVLDGGRPR